MYSWLAAGILVEIVATSFLKFTEGFTRLWPTLARLVLYGLAFLFVAQAISHGMQVGVAYALWSAIGTTVIVVVGAAFLGEPLSVPKVVGIGFVVAGVVLLHLTGGG